MIYGEDKGPIIQPIDEGVGAHISITPNLDILEGSGGRWVLFKNDPVDFFVLTAEEMSALHRHMVKEYAEERGDL